MRTLKNIFKSVYLPVKVLFVISLLFIVFYKYFFLKINEIFIGAAILGELFYNLFLAILASVIFYFVVVHLKDFYDKKDVFKIINHRAKGFINIRNRIQKELLEKNNYKKEDVNLSEDFVKELFSNISPNDNSPIVIYPSVGNHTWLDFLILFTHKTLDVIKNTYQFMPYLDSKLLNYIYKIETSTFIVNLKLFNETIIYKDPDLSPFAKSYYDYSKIVDELNLYIEEKTKLYT